MPNGLEATQGTAAVEATALPIPLDVAPVARPMEARDGAAELAARVAALEAKVAELDVRAPRNKATIIVFSGDMDKVLAALVIATGAAAMGMEVALFHTFWGLMPLRKGRKVDGKNLLEGALQYLTPAGIGKLSPSKLAMMGAGARVFRKLMKDKEVQSPEELLALARETGVRITACTMSMDVMGIGEDELMDGLQFGGVAAYLADAAESKVTLFI
jgi:peroxiredoxin family protein